jgi:hypothetical protein
VPTVLIASAASLLSIRQRGDFPDAMTFADTDALRALEAITRHRPGLVVLESTFAATSRGTALANRIKADASLSACEVRVVTLAGPDQSAAPPVPAAEPAARNVNLAAAAARVPVASSPPISAAVRDTPPGVPDRSTPTHVAVDSNDKRRRPRFDMITDEVLVDGNPATLIDLSLQGAQIVSPTTLRPNRRVRLTLPVGLVPIRLIGEIAWAMFEMPQGRPQYRAGISWIDPDTAVIQRFLDSQTK